jgi:hypothetical protein
MSSSYALADLQRRSWDELDKLYIEAPPGPVPEGLFDGTFLIWLPPAKKLRNLPYVCLETLGFRCFCWGIDFVDRKWWIAARALRGGKFTPIQAASRWRPTQTWQLHYDGDGIPCVDRILYDEVKTLTPDLCLGIGGINAEQGIGDHFYFALRRR